MSSARFLVAILVFGCAFHCRSIRGICDRLMAMVVQGARCDQFQKARRSVWKLLQALLCLGAKTDSYLNQGKPYAKIMRINTSTAQLRSSV